MKIDVGLLGSRLAKLRELRGMSLSATADAAGIAKSYLAKLERGEVENPGLKTLDGVARALGVTLADLLAPKNPSTDRPPENEVEELERLIATMPPSLRVFIDSVEKREEQELSMDVVRSLASVQFRGKRPETADDWNFLYLALKKSTR